MHDPGSYLTPDVVADFSQVRFRPDGLDRVHVSGASGRPRPETLKVTVGYRDGYIGETQLSYGGTGCVARARLAADVLAPRLGATGIPCLETRLDILGVNSLFGEALGCAAEPPEARVRLAVHVASREDAELTAGLADGLTLGGPYGGGGPTLAVREVIAVCSVYLLREVVRPAWTILEA